MPRPLEGPKIREDITQEKRRRREEAVVMLQALLTESYRRGMESPGRGGVKSRQKWFQISASLAQSLARLVSELEYEKLRAEVDAMKKRVEEQYVARPRVTFSQTRAEIARQGPSEH